MGNETFVNGISPGGLTDRGEIKLLVCYLLKTLGKPFTRNQINEILDDYKVANYFEINGAISDLIDAGQIEAEAVKGDEILTITERGAFATTNIERTLPKTVRERSVKAALKVIERERVMKESIVEVTPLDQGFHVTFIIKDMNTELLKITMYVSDESQVELVKKNFYDNAVSVYSDIISTLTT